MYLWSHILYICHTNHLVPGLRGWEGGGGGKILNWMGCRSAIHIWLLESRLANLHPVKTIFCLPAASLPSGVTKSLGRQREAEQGPKKSPRRSRMCWTERRTTTTQPAPVCWRMPKKQKFLDSFRLTTSVIVFLLLLFLYMLFYSLTFDVRRIVRQTCDLFIISILVFHVSFNMIHICVLDLFVFFHVWFSEPLDRRTYIYPCLFLLQRKIINFFFFYTQ